MEKQRSLKSKSKSNESNMSSEKKCKLDMNSFLFTSFSSYQCELDAKNDKYERLVKLSRDITIESKRTIFSLLRREEGTENLIKDGEEKFQAIKKLLLQVSAELTNEDPYRFARAISPGIQEFVEAVTLMYYIKDRKLITYNELYKLYFCFGDDCVLLTQYDFMLGVADLTGELMRMAINRIGSREFNEAEDICQILRSIYREFSMFAYDHREMSKKINVMKASLNKVENACYNVKVRGSEVPDNMLSEIALSENVYVE